MPRVATPPDVREAILDATMRLMERYGYKKMTMEDIAQEAQIGKATIYGHFNNKEDVAISVIDRHQRRFLEQWQELAVTDTPPDARLRLMLLTHVLYGFDKAQCYRQSMDETLASLRHLVLPKREQYVGKLALILMVVVQEGCDKGLFVCDDALIAARTLMTCIGAFGPTNLSPRELGERDEIAARTNQVVDLVLHGLFLRTKEHSET